MLIGREREVATLRGLLDGDHGVVAVTGTAGLGKTAIVRTVADDEAVWLHGLASWRERPGAALSLVVPTVFGDLERDASRLMRHVDGRELVLDDAQWVDPYTLAVVELVATATRPVATWRSGDPATPAPPPVHWTCVALEPLRPADARVLACQRRPALTAPELAHLLEMANGSPLLIEELASAPSPSPNLVSALLARLAALPEDVRKTVVMVAAAEAGVPEASVDRHAADELERSGLAVLAQQRWRPRHALLQESVLEVVDPQELRCAFTALAAQCRSQDPAAAARYAARAGLRSRAVTLAHEARARAEGPLETARATVGLADLLESEDPCEAFRLRVTATAALRVAGAFTEVLAAFDGHPLASGDPQLLGMAHVNLAAAHWELGDPATALEHAEHALDLVQGTGSEAELLVRAGMALHRTRVHFDGPGALLFAKEALRIAEERGEHVSYARTRVAAALLLSGDPGWRDEIDRAVIDAVNNGDETGERLARETRHLHAFVGGDLDTARADLHALTDGTRDGWPAAKPRYRAVRLVVELLALECRSTIVERAEQLLEAEPIFHQRAMAVAAGAAAAVELGRADIAERLLADVEPRDGEEQLVLAWARSELAWATGRTTCNDRGDPIPANHPAATMTSVMRAWHSAEAGVDPPPAPAMPLPGFAMAIDEMQSIQLLTAGDLCAAIELFDQTAARWATGSDRRGILRCQWGAALAADRLGTADSLERLEACWQDATSIGAAPVATRAGRALRRRGVHTAPFPAVPEAPLSAPETQVLRLVAAGLATDEVATALGLQTCTVDDHLHSALNRLGFRHRAEAVCWIASRT